MTIFPGGPQDNITYTLTAPDGSIAVFNNPLDANYVGMIRWTGLDGVDIREAIDPRSGADGGVQGLNFRGPRAITGIVDIIPTSTTDRNQKVTKLKRAINARIADGTMTFTPDGGAPQQQLKYRLSQPHRRDPSRSGFATQYQFGLTAADPNIYSSTLHTSTVNASPWQATVTNQGDGQAPPQISVSVPIATPVALTNVTTGQTVNLNGIAAAFGSYALTFSPGTVGSAPGQLSTPMDAAVDSGGNVFVVDEANNRVQKFNSSGVYQSQFGTAGTGNGQFQFPVGIAIDAGGKIWVVDSGNFRIQRFSAAGAYETQFGSFGTGNGQFNSTFSRAKIAIDSATNIFVTDPGNNRIQKLTAGTPPVYASQFGTLGSGNNNLNSPRGIAVDNTGTSLLIADNGNARVKRVTNASPPVFTADYAMPLGISPWYVTTDSAGNFFVSWAGNNLIAKFNSSGVYQSQFGGTGNGPTQFSAPRGLAMLGSTTTPLYVVDSGNNRVQKLNITGASAVLDLDFSIASVAAGGQNYYSLVDVPNSTWWALAPGDNLIQVTGGTSWTINWRDAWE